MKICKHCQAAMADEDIFCSTCGTKAEEDETVLAEEAAAEAAVTEDAEEAPEAPAPEETPAVEEAPKKKSRKGLIAGLALAVILVVAVIVIKGSYDQNAGKRVSAGYHTNAYGYESYSVHFAAAEDGSTAYSYMNEDGETVEIPAENVDAMMDQVVASCAGMELDNRQLQYYFDQEYYSFYSMYSSYLAYFMDTTKGLDEQMDLEGTGTWQQSFVNGSVEMFYQIAALNAEAVKAGHVLTEEEQANLDSFRDMQTVAESYGYEDLDQFMYDYVGPAATVDSYLAFLEANMMANSYANYLIEQTEVTEEEVEAYYDANVDMMTTSYGIQKIDKNVINVRHILIQPESTTAEDGTITITDEAWAAAEAEAQRIYDEWQAGEATEDAFAELANTYSTDGGSNTNGGLYEDVYPGQMVTEFNDWCFADGRQVGDHTIVKTSYGYHVMFFSGEGDYVYWRMAAEDLCRQEKAADERAALTAAYESSADLTKAVILDAIAPTAPAVEEDTAAEE